MATDREALVKKAQGLKGKAKKARGENKKAIAKAFRNGARRLARKVKQMPKPVAAPKDAAEAPAG